MFGSLHRMAGRIRAVFQSNELDRDLRMELEAHIQLLAEEHIRKGASQEQAQRPARIELGGGEQLREAHRDVRALPWLDTLLQDLRFAFRLFRNSPGFTAIAVLTLALGIGASTTIFSWVRSVLLNPLPGVANPERVAALETLAPNGEWLPSSYLDFRDLRDGCKLSEKMSVTKPMDLAVGNEDSFERVWGEAVSGDFFDLLQLKPEIGRFFSREEVDHEQNAHHLVVIGHSYWASHLHSDPQAIGTTLRIGRFPYTIIGVAPATFSGSMAGLSFQMWVPERPCTANWRPQAIRRSLTGNGAPSAFSCALPMG